MPRGTEFERGFVLVAMVAPINDPAPHRQAGTVVAPRPLDSTGCAPGVAPMTPVTPRILYFGMDGLLSALPLRALLTAGARVVAVVTPSTAHAAVPPTVRQLEPPAAADPPRGRPLAPPGVAQLAWSAGIPLLAATRLNAGATLRALAALGPELIVVSCFSLRLPPALLALPALGALNVHPSLLPENRGPAPLFWTFRDATGDGPIRAGVTIHQLTCALDAGPIVIQEALLLPDGLTAAELEPRLAALAAELIPPAIAGLVDGSLQPEPQDEAGATAHSWPTADDFTIGTNRPARWAFNAIRGASGWGAPLRLHVAGASYVVTGAVGYDPDATLSHPAEWAGGILRVRCEPGVLMVTVKECDAPVPH